MVRGSIFFYGAINLVFLQKEQNSTNYCEALETGLSPFVVDVLEESQS